MNLTEEKENILSGLSEEETFSRLFNTAVNHSYPAALWRCPDGNVKNFITDFANTLLKERVDIEQSVPGFIISPFINPENKASHFIRADLSWSIVENSSKKNITQGKEREAEIFLHEAELPKALTFPKEKNLSSPASSPASKEQFSSAVTAATEAIEFNAFKKVVLARSKNIPNHHNLSPVGLFIQLCLKYPGAFVSLTWHPVTGLWIGAAPEILVNINKEKIFHTIALAGTQALEEIASLQNAVWTQKEIEEQALVSRYIINCFKTIRLRDFEEDGPQTVRAGNLIHLRTDFWVDMKKVDFPELGSQMLDLLHPTSAVCGSPKKEAFDFIQKNEHLDREIFSGYIGPVNFHKETNIFVNLRCARIFHDNIVLYAGAGITRDSKPELEWKETELKMNVIGSMFSKDA